MRYTERKTHSKGIIIIFVIANALPVGNLRIGLVKTATLGRVVMKTIMAKIGKGRLGALGKETGTSVGVVELAKENSERLLMFII